jgi:hypothetical protein
MRVADCFATHSWLEFRGHSRSGWRAKALNAGFMLIGPAGFQGRDCKALLNFRKEISKPESRPWRSIAMAAEVWA